MTGFRSSLAPHISTGPVDPFAARRLGRQAWHDTGVAVIDPAWLASPAERRQLAALADKVHGKRGGA